MDAAVVASSAPALACRHQGQQDTLQHSMLQPTGQAAADYGCTFKGKFCYQRQAQQQPEVPRGLEMADGSAQGPEDSTTQGCHASHAISCGICTVTTPKENAKQAMPLEIASIYNLGIQL